MKLSLCVIKFLYNHLGSLRVKVRTITVYPVLAGYAREEAYTITLLYKAQQNPSRYRRTNHPGNIRPHGMHQ